MGDLRNKVAKQMRDEAHRRFIAERYPPRPAPALPRCQCGNTYRDTRLWAHQEDRWKPVVFYCVGCLPIDLVPILINDIVNMPEGT